MGAGARQRKNERRRIGDIQFVLTSLVRSIIWIGRAAPRPLDSGGRPRPSIGDGARTTTPVSERRGGRSAGRPHHHQDIDDKSDDEAMSEGLLKDSLRSPQLSPYFVQTWAAPHDFHLGGREGIYNKINSFRRARSPDLMALQVAEVWSQQSNCSAVSLLYYNAMRSDSILPRTDTPRRTQGTTTTGSSRFYYGRVIVQKLLP